MDEIQEIFAELDRLREEMRRMEARLERYVDNEIAYHKRIEH